MTEPEWSWPNQQAVRGDHSGPGMNTPAGIPSDVMITYGHAGLDYEFLLLTTGGEAVAGTVGWDFGDGAPIVTADAGVPATHTYAGAGSFNVWANIKDRVRSLALVVGE